MDAAHRIFILAIEKNFVQGRLTTNVAASCLYIVCRREKSPHMLLDFSEALQENVFKLGRTFVPLCKELGLSLPTVDPSLYIHRFASRLSLGEGAQEVAMTALRIVARMCRDWIVAGRKPSGACGAALLIAVRVHGFRRTRGQVLQALRIVDTTLRNRLAEFEATSAGDVAVEDLEALDAPGGGAADPPSFIRGRLKDELGIRHHHLVQDGSPEALAELRGGDPLAGGYVTADTLAMIDASNVLREEELARRALQRGLVVLDDDGMQARLPSLPASAGAQSGSASGAASTALVPVAPSTAVVPRAEGELVPASTPRLPRSQLHERGYKALVAQICAEPTALRKVARVIPPSTARHLKAEAILNMNWGKGRRTGVQRSDSARVAASALSLRKNRLNRIRRDILASRIARRKRRRRRRGHRAVPLGVEGMVLPTIGWGSRVDSDSETSDGSSDGAPPPPPIKWKDVLELPSHDSSDSEWEYAEHVPLGVAPPLTPSLTAGPLPKPKHVHPYALRADDILWGGQHQALLQEDWLVPEDLPELSEGDSGDEQKEAKLPRKATVLAPPKPVSVGKPGASQISASTAMPAVDGVPGSELGDGARELPEEEWPGPLDEATEALVKLRYSHLYGQRPDSSSDEEDDPEGGDGAAWSSVGDGAHRPATAPLARQTSPEEAAMYQDIANTLAQRLIELRSKAEGKKEAGAALLALVPASDRSQAALAAQLLSPVQSKAASHVGAGAHQVSLQGATSQDLIKDANADFAVPSAGDPTDDLSALDAELGDVFLPQQEVKQRQVVWEGLHGEYMNDLAQRISEGKVLPRKRRRRPGDAPPVDAEVLDASAAAAAVQAMVASRATSRKLNYDVVQGMRAAFAGLSASASKADGEEDLDDVLGLGDEEEEEEGGPLGEAGAPQGASGVDRLGMLGGRKRPRAASVSLVVGEEDDDDEEEDEGGGLASRILGGTAWGADS